MRSGPPDHAPPLEEVSGVEAEMTTPGELQRLRRGRTLGWLSFLLAGTGLAAVLGLGLEDGARARGDLARARDEAAEMRQAAFRAEDLLTAARRELVEERGATAALMKEASAQQAALSGTDKLIADLRAQLDVKDGEVSVNESNRVTVSLVDEILFKSGEADLSPRGQEVLGRVGGVLKALTDKQIVIGGHTDDVPIKNERFPSNWELSAARAVNVVRHLADVVGVDPRKLAAAGYSQFHPRSKNRAKNRRIEILLTPMVQVKKR